MLNHLINNINELLIKEQSSYSKSDLDVLLNIKADILNMYEEKLSLKEKIANLKNRHMVFQNSVYVDKNEENQHFYCTLCWDKYNLAIHLIQSYPDNKYECKNCNAYYFVSDAIILGTNKKSKQ